MNYLKITFAYYYNIIIILFSKTKWNCTWEAGVHMKHLSHNEPGAAIQTVTQQLSPVWRQTCDEFINEHTKYL